MELTVSKLSLSLSLSLSLIYLNACELTPMLILRCQSRVLYVISSIIVKENNKIKMMLIITGNDNLDVILLLKLAYFWLICRNWI